MISSELDEILALSDRIAVMYKGQIIDIVPAAKATKGSLGLLMAGIKSDKAPESDSSATDGGVVERVF
jgi:simple sugar transport system ATP-binding protein